MESTSYWEAASSLTVHHKTLPNRQHILYTPSPHHHNQHQPHNNPDTLTATETLADSGDGVAVGLDIYAALELHDAQVVVGVAVRAAHWGVNLGTLLLTRGRARIAAVTVTATATTAGTAAAAHWPHCVCVYG